MRQTGIFNAGYGAEAFGFRDLAGLHWNLQAPQLYAEAIRRDEAVIAQGGALVAETGAAHGPQPERQSDRPRRHHRGHRLVGRQQRDDARAFRDVCSPTSSTTRAGASCSRRTSTPAPIRKRDVRVRVFTEYAWHSLFIRNLLIRPQASALADVRPGPDDRRPAVVPRRPGAATATRSQTVIACDFTRRIVLIGGTRYAGEMKKSVFSYLNFILPDVERAADALLGQFRRARRRRDLLRPVGHRQDDAVGRSRAGR